MTRMHPCCDACWAETHFGNVPSRAVSLTQETCCFCRRLTNSGIFVQADPDELKCYDLHAPAQADGLA